jgi:Ca2+-binding EF-hand superfamily protein
MSAERWCTYRYSLVLLHAYVLGFYGANQVDKRFGLVSLNDYRALGLPPDSPAELSLIRSAVDPTNTGFVTYASFVAAVAAKLHSRSEESLATEVESAYRLFTRGTDGPITLTHLRRIARDLKEDSVGDDLLKDMIREANGGDSINAGVNLDQFRNVMSRAGLF